MTKVSVIVPIYNVEEYLEKCLDSIINQTYKNIEIICVEDCSTDNSKKVLENFAQKDSRIKIIYHPTNKGLSAARNTGIDNSNGEYIYFIDSDDWIDENYIECLVNAAIKSNSEIVLNTNIIRHFNATSSIPHMPHKTYNKISDTFIESKTAIQNVIWNTWAHLWKKSFLERTDARFPEGRLIEDIYFQMITYAQTDRIYIIRDSVYHHSYHSGSIMTTINRAQVFDEVMKITNLAIDYLEKWKIENIIKAENLPDDIKNPKTEAQKAQHEALIKRISLQ